MKRRFIIIVSCLAVSLADSSTLQATQTGTKGLSAYEHATWPGHATWARVEALGSNDSFAAISKERSALPSDALRRLPALFAEAATEGKLPTIGLIGAANPFRRISAPHLFPPSPPQDSIDTLLPPPLKLLPANTASDSFSDEELDWTSTDKVNSAATPEPKVTPWGAVWRSLLLPGWGQYYVESYWKAPLALGAAGFFAFRIIDFNNQFTDVCREIEASDDDDPLLPFLKRNREFYRDKRDESAFYLAIVYLISTIDAYVGAHLYEFDVSDDLSAAMNFDPATSALRLTVSW